MFFSAELLPRVWHNAAPQPNIVANLPVDWATMFGCGAALRYPPGNSSALTSKMICKTGSSKNFSAYQAVDAF